MKLAIVSLASAIVGTYAAPKPAPQSLEELQAQADANGIDLDLSALTGDGAAEAADGEEVQEEEDLEVEAEGEPQEGEDPEAAAAEEAAAAAEAGQVDAANAGGEDGADGEEGGEEQGGEVAAEDIDINILQFALTLEFLEATFYQQGLEQISEAQLRREGLTSSFNVRFLLQQIFKHEATHITTIQDTITSLGGTPNGACTFNFEFATAREFLAIGKTLEKVGVSAYSGAAPLISNPDILAAAASILTVEARHTAALSMEQALDPIPEDFDTALGPNSVLTLAAPFIADCPFELDFGLDLAPFETLTLGNSLAKVGEFLAVEDSFGGQFCQFLSNNAATVVPLSEEGCQVPEGLRGDAYVCITNSEEPVTTANEKDVIVAGPAVFTVDTFDEDSCNKDFFNVEIDLAAAGQDALPEENENAQEQEQEAANEEVDADGEAAVDEGQVDPAAAGGDQGDAAADQAAGDAEAEAGEDSSNGNDAEAQAESGDGTAEGSVESSEQGASEEQQGAGAGEQEMMWY